jgi:hypothetical protein
MKRPKWYEKPPKTARGDLHCPALHEGINLLYCTHRQRNEINAAFRVFCKKCKNRLPE